MDTTEPANINHYLAWEKRVNFGEPGAVRSFKKQTCRQPIIITDVARKTKTLKLAILHYMFEEPTFSTDIGTDTTELGLLK